MLSGSRNLACFLGAYGIDGDPQKMSKITPDNVKDNSAFKTCAFSHFLQGK
jgi:hypothetical protein